MIQITLHPLDIIIVITYCLGMIGLGFWFSRQQKTISNYLLGDREVSCGLVLVSIVATETSTVTFLSVTGKGFGTWNPTTQQYDPGNFTFLQIAMGYIIGRILISYWLLPFYFNGRLYSAYQVLHQRFSPLVQKTASITFLLTRLFADGLRLYLAGLFLSGCLDWPLAGSITSMGCLTLLYTYFGGIMAIFWADLIQFIIKVTGAVVALFCVLIALPGGLQEFCSRAADIQQLRMFETAFHWSVAQNIWAGLLGGAFLSMATHGVDQMMVQRYLCSKSLNQARFAVISSGLVVFVQFALFIMVGMGFYQLMQSQIFHVPANTPADKVFALFLAGDWIPVGVRGLIIAAVLSAAMSTLAASWNSTASAIVFDLYKPLKPNQPEQHYFRVSRQLTLVAGMGQITIALLAIHFVNQRNIIDMVLEIASLSAGLLLGLFILGSMKQPVTSRAALSGMITGLIVVNFVYWSKYWGVVIAWPWLTPAGTLTTVCAGLLCQHLYSRRSLHP